MAFVALDRPDHTGRRGRREAIDRRALHRHDGHRPVRNGALRLPTTILQAGVERGYRRRERIRSARPVVIGKSHNDDVVRFASAEGNHADAANGAFRARQRSSVGRSTGPALTCTQARSKSHSRALLLANSRADEPPDTMFAGGWLADDARAAGADPPVPDRASSDGVCDGGSSARFRGAAAAPVQTRSSPPPRQLQAGAQEIYRLGALLV
jgi:hypothetical protein